MAARNKKEGYETASSGRQDITALLAQIPERLFVQMVTKAGLPTADARRLCEAFREIKE